jgi:adenine-specific DNA glycosylase
VTPDEFRLNAHHWLILHGRYVCIARVPRCPECVIADLCEYKAKTRALPGVEARALPLKPPAKRGGVARKSER